MTTLLSVRLPLLLLLIVTGCRSPRCSRTPAAPGDGSAAPTSPSAEPEADTPLEASHDPGASEHRQVQAAEEAPQGASPSAGWIELFDGHSFEHWRGYRQESMPAGWVVDEQAMFASTPGAGMDIVTRDVFADFELEFEWKVGPGGNSGLMWHVDEEAGAYPWLSGPEYQLLDDAAYHGGAIGRNSAASNYDVHAPSQALTRPAGEWNQARILVDGPHVEHWLNGVKVVEYEKGSTDHRERVAASKWARVPTYGRSSTGRLAIQGDHGQIWIRGIRIRRLD